MMIKEYKAERANVPIKSTLICLNRAYKALEQNNKNHARYILEVGLDQAIDIREVGDIQEILTLISNITDAKERIAEILTCGGRIYDEYSDMIGSSDKENVKGE